MLNLSFDRGRIRSIKNEILAENPHTQLRTENGKLIVRLPHGDNLTDKQRDLAATHKQELVEYLSTPPAAGQCIGGHDTEWIITKYGDWVCSCYRAKELASRLALSSSNKKRNCL